MLGFKGTFELKTWNEGKQPKGSIMVDGKVIDFFVTKAANIDEVRKDLLSQPVTLIGGSWFIGPVKEAIETISATVD